MNNSATEKELVEIIMIWQSKGRSFEDAVAVIPLPKPFLGDYLPAVDDYVTDECFVLNTNEQFSRDEAISYLKALWGKADAISI